MPVDSSTTYIPLDGSASGGCWRSLTSLEKRLILLTIVLGVTVFALSIAFAYKRCEDHHPNITTIAPTPPPTHAPTTASPTAKPTVKPSSIPLPTSTTASSSSAKPTVKTTRKNASTSSTEQPNLTSVTLPSSSKGPSSNLPPTAQKTPNVNGEDLKIATEPPEGIVNAAALQEDPSASSKTEDVLK